MMRILRVMYVEDDEDQARLSLKAWAQYMTVVVIDNSIEAINLIGCDIQGFDFVLVDFNLKRTSGLRVTNFAMELEIPCALITAYSEREIKYRCPGLKCPVWSKRSLMRIPEMIAEMIDTPHGFVVDPRMLETSAFLDRFIGAKTRFMKMIHQD